jgi:hypothetical protein
MFGATILGGIVLGLAAGPLTYAGSRHLLGRINIGAADCRKRIGRSS